MNEKEMNEFKEITPKIQQEMIDEYTNIGIFPWTIFLKDIGKINVIDMTGVVNRATGEAKVLALDDDYGMWTIKEEDVRAQRNNVMKLGDFEHFNEMKKQSEENTKRWEEKEKKLGLNANLNKGFMWLR